MEEIHSRFSSHQIIIDSSAILSTPDPLVLANLVEGIIMVIRTDTPRNYVKQAVRSLDSSKLMGIVVNANVSGIASYYHPKN